jgi:hypothetical protein
MKYKYSTDFNIVFGQSLIVDRQNVYHLMDGENDTLGKNLFHFQDSN